MKRKSKIMASIVLTLVLSCGTAITALAGSASGTVGSGNYGFGCSAYKDVAEAVTTVSNPGDAYVYASATQKNNRTGAVKSLGSGSASQKIEAHVYWYAESGYSVKSISSSHTATYGGSSISGSLSDTY